MKKFFILLLALIVLGAGALIALSALNEGSEDPGTPSTGTELDVFECAAKDVQPTKIVSLTSYTLAQDLNGDRLTLSGSFTQVSQGMNSILDYKYQRIATPEDLAENYILETEGAIAVKNGTYKQQIGDAMGSWEAIIPSLQQLGALKISKQALPSDYQLSSDGKKLTVSLSRQEALAALGVSIGGAQSDISLEVQSNGKNITLVKIAYTEASGAAVTINTSYTYGKETLDFSRFN